jgi:hypothetical protein
VEVGTNLRKEYERTNIHLYVSLVLCALNSFENSCLLMLGSVRDVCCRILLQQMPVL